MFSLPWTQQNGIRRDEMDKNPDNSEGSDPRGTAFHAVASNRANLRHCATYGDPWPFHNDP